MIMCMIAASAFVMPVQAQSDNPLSAKFVGPSVVSLGGVTQYTITVAGGPAENTNGTYSYKVLFTGYAATNATLTPNTGSSKTGVFNFNLTTPKVLGDLTMTLSASSSDGTNTTYNNETKMVVKVIHPVVFTVNIKNTGNMTVTNIPVYFWVDYVDSTSKPVYVANVTIDALSTKAVTYNWTTTSLGTGSHVLKVEIDPTASFVLFDVGGTVMTNTFYYNQSGYGTTNALLYVALVTLVFVVFMVYRRPVPRKKK
jgi:hypothetical protein